MERQVVFRDRQELQGADLNNVEAYARAALDNVVHDGISDGKAYAGFLVTQRNATEIAVAPGRFYREGQVYSRDDTVVKDLLASLPVAVKRIVAVVTFGSETDSDVQPRDFLVDAETGQTEPQAVAMERRRFSEINTVAGVESADPQPPVMDANLLPIAYVTLKPTGIESILMLGDSALPNLRRTDARLRDVETWRSVTEPRIGTIASDIAGLALAQKGLAGLKLVTQIAQDVANVKDTLNIADGAKNYASDNFLTTWESNPAAVGYDAQVQEGIRFGWAAQADSVLGLFNQYNADVKLAGDGMLLPAYDDVPRLILSQYAGELSVSQYQFQSFSMVQKTMSRVRLRYGPTFQVCTNSWFWQSGVLGYKRVETSPGDFHTIATLTKDGEVFQIENPDQALHDPHYMARLRQIWFDGYQEPYWEKVTNTLTVNGSQVGQTFLNSQDGWLTKVALNFTKLGADGAVGISVVECYRGAPDIEQVLTHVTVQRADLKLHPAQTVVSIPPTFMKAGGRYAILVTTGGNHYVATVSGADYAQGTLFYSTDGAYLQADLTKDLMLTLSFARFKRPFVVADLNPLQLSGGITAVDLLHEGYTPASCELRYEVQVNGQWGTLDQYTAGQLAGMPALLPLRVVFIGTSDVMPGLRLTGSRARVARPKTTFRHFSVGRVLAQPTSRVEVTSRLEWFRAAAHTLAVKLKIGAAEIAASTVTETVEDADSGYVIRKYVFILGTPATGYQIIHDGTTSSAANTFHVAGRFDIAY